MIPLRHVADALGLKTRVGIRVACSAGVLALVLFALNGCAATNTLQIQKWALPASGECRLLGADLAVKGDVLQSIIGPNFVPELDSAGGKGTLRIEVLGCQSASVFDRLEAPQAIGRILIELDESKLPFRLSGVDRWDSYALHIAKDTAEAEGPFARFMRAHQLASVSGQASLVVPDDESANEPNAALLGVIKFAGGALTIRARRVCEPQPFEQRRAMVGTGADDFSLFFGSERGRVCRLAGARLMIEGVTPLSDLELDTAQAVINYQEALSWSLTIWRQANLSLD